MVTLRTFRGGVTLAVQDDGLGAPTLLLRSIGSSFTHFGLRGLQERIKKVGGVFTARNGEDGGLVVRARVPVSGLAWSTPEVRAETQPTLPIRVLLVDDHEVVRTGLRTMLGGDWTSRSSARRAAAAWRWPRRASSRPISCCSTRGCQMDGGRGLSAFATATPDLAVVILTTFADDDLVRRCVRAGARVPAQRHRPPGPWPQLASGHAR